MRACVNDISDWMFSNRLCLNSDKTEFIWLTSLQNANKVPSGKVNVCGSSEIEPASSVRNLGVIFDRSFTFHDHISGIVRSCYHQLRQIRQARRSLSRDNLKTLLHAFVLSRLDYCNSLLAGQPSCVLHRLQIVQNSAARLYAGLSRYDSISQVLRDELHWLQVPYRIVYKLCVLVYRCLHGMAPTYLSDFCKPLSAGQLRSCRNRSAAAGNLSVPRTRLMTYGTRSFAVSGPMAWNSLPAHLKTDQSFNSFKSGLKTYLFNCCYN